MAVGVIKAVLQAQFAQQWAFVRFKDRHAVIALKIATHIELGQRQPFVAALGKGRARQPQQGADPGGHPGGIDQIPDPQRAKAGVAKAALDHLIIGIPGKAVTALKRVDKGRNTAVTVAKEPFLVDVSQPGLAALALCIQQPTRPMRDVMIGERRQQRGPRISATLCG